MDKVVKELVYWSCDLKLHHGEPPEKQLRFALIQILMGMAKRIENTTIRDEIWFPLNAPDFPIRMTLSSEELLWDFTLKLRIENSNPILSTIEEDEKDTID